MIISYWSEFIRTSKEEIIESFSASDEHSCSEPPERPSGLAADKGILARGLTSQVWINFIFHKMQGGNMPDTNNDVNQVGVILDPPKGEGH